MKNYNQSLKKAKTFFDQNQFESAQNCLLNVLKEFELNLANKSNLYLLLADINTKLNDFKKTNDYFSKYLEINPNNPKVLNLAANNFSKMRQYKKAEEHYLKAIDLKADYEGAIINLAVLYDNLGNKVNAINFYKKAIEINPNNFGVIFNMSKLEKKILDEKKIVLIRKYLDSNKYDFFNIASGYFLLAENENRKKNFKDEVYFLEKANSYSFQSKEKINKQAVNYWMNIIPKKFDNFSFIEKTKISEETKNLNPIFIVGLPRSGSTLTETIISSGKNNILSFGESNLVNWSILNTHRKALFNEDLSIVLDIDLIKNKLLNSYNNLYFEEENRNIRFIDKSLENFYYINLILKIFPNAKFIHTYRNLEDNIFSIYKEFLHKISWSHSLENILYYIDNYLKVIKKIKINYPDKIISVSLEELTANPKDISEDIFNFCNLEWDANCLNFQKRKNLFSSTASNNQIRAGIQNYNNKKYENYHFLLNNYKSKYKWLKSI